MITVVIPLYNKEKLIGATLRSVLTQTYQDFEIVVVDDGSTDGSVAVVEKIDDPRIRIIRQQNAGASAARNTGIREAKGDYIAFLDADDEWKPRYLQVQHNMTEKYPDCGIYGTNFEYRDEDGSIRPTIINNLKISGTDGIMVNYFEIGSTSTPPLWTSAIMIRRNLFDEIDGFPVGINLGEDLLVWAKLACKCKIAYYKEPMAVYNFATMALAGTPVKKPDPVDVVGDELKKLSLQYNIPYLNNYIARWHKIRMTTFIPHGMHKEARLEYAKVKLYVKPDMKTRIWYILNMLPLPLTKWLIRMQKKSGK